MFCLRLIGFLPLARSVRCRNLYGSNLIFGAVGGPVGVIGGDDVGLRHRMVESGVDNAWRHPIGHLRAQRRLARTALEAYPVAIAKAAVLRSEEHTSELQSLMRISYAVFCLKKKKNNTINTKQHCKR